MQKQRRADKGVPPGTGPTVRYFRGNLGETVEQSGGYELHHPAQFDDQNALVPN